MSALQLSGLRVCHGAVQALRGVDLTLAAGQAMALLGTNGAGKTSLLQAIAGVHLPEAGTVHWEGRAIQGWEADAVARAGIALVPEGRQLFPFMSVEDNLRMGAWARPGGGVVDDLQQMYALAPRLRERRALRAGALSGGEQQMLAIARALMGRPRLLLLDEPALGLAPDTARDILATVFARARSAGMAVLVAEQNAALVLPHVQQLVVLQRGLVAARGAAGDPALQAALQPFVAARAADPFSLH